MKTVVFVSEKGGVGKTRLSDELYFYYMRQNVPVSGRKVNKEINTKSEKYVEYSFMIRGRKSE